jgi:hypothetical protein
MDPMANINDPHHIASVPRWLNIMSSGLTVLSCLLYIALFYSLKEYQDRLATLATDIPVFTRVILNIYQSYISVFVLISVALLLMYFIKSRRAAGGYKIVVAMIVANSVFAATLYLVSVVGMI